METWLKADSNWTLLDLHTNGIRMYPIKEKQKEVCPNSRWKVHCYKADSSKISLI